MKNIFTMPSEKRKRLDPKSLQILDAAESAMNRTEIASELVQLAQDFSIYKVLSYDVRRVASNCLISKSPNLEDIKITVGRGGRGPTINLFSTEKPKAVRDPGTINLHYKNPQLTEKEEDWTLGEKWKPKQIGKLYLEKRLLGSHKLAEGAPEAFKGSKSQASRKYNLSKVFAVYSVVIGGEYRNKGFGIALYLKALELASKRGLWLVNDTDSKTSGDAKRTWKALFRYASKTIMGPPAPELLFDYDKQEYEVGYRKYNLGDGGDTVVPTHRPMFGAYGLNSSGKKIIQAET